MKDLRLRGAWNIELMDVSLNLITPSRDYVACKHILNWWPVVVISLTANHKPNLFSLFYWLTVTLLKWTSSTVDPLFKPEKLEELEEAD